MKQWTITQQNDTNKRIDVFLNENTDLSRTKISELIRDGGVLCNGDNVKAKYKLKMNDIVEAAEYTVKPLHIDPIVMNLDIVYEDDVLCVINKPQGLVVHPGKGIHEPTLLNGLVAHFNKDSSRYIKPGMVHRIDKDTSGLLVIAKNDQAHAFLANQLLDKTMTRFYYAIVHGTLMENTTVDAPIGPMPNSHKMMITEKNGKSAVTHINIIERYAKHTLIECRLETGRTHQIRVHTQYISHPIVNDPLYSHDINPTGQYLCAYHLEFIHPTTNSLMQFNVPLPNHFNKLIQSLEV